MNINSVSSQFASKLLKWVHTCISNCGQSSPIILLFFVDHIAILRKAQQG